MKISQLPAVTPDGTETVVVLKGGAARRAGMGSLVGAAFDTALAEAQPAFDAQVARAAVHVQAASAAALTASLAATAALVAQPMYDTVAEGLAATGVGEVFAVRGSGLTYATAYRHDAGATPVPLGSFPSLEALESFLSMFHFPPGIVADGATDMRQLLADFDASLAAGSVIALPDGDIRIASNLTIRSGLNFLTGRARLKPDPGVQIIIAGGVACRDNQHVFLLNPEEPEGIRIAELGRPYVTPEMFGAKNDRVADDWLPVTAAIRCGRFAINSSQNSSWKVCFLANVRDPSGNGGFGTCGYRCSRTVIVNRTVILEGIASGYTKIGGGATICGDDGLKAVMLVIAGATLPAGSPGTEPVPPIGGANRSVIRNLTLQGKSPSGVEQAFITNAVVYLDNLRATNFRYCGFHFHADTAHKAGATLFDLPNTVSGSTGLFNGRGSVAGNCNGSEVRNCFAACTDAPTDRGRLAFCTHGNNCGTVLFSGCDADAAGCGYCESSNVGSTFVGCQSAQNAYKISHNGVVYIAIKGHVSSAESEPGLGADWKRYWAPNGSSLPHAAWATATEYWPCGSVNVSSFASLTTIVGHYTEGGIEIGIFGRAGTAVFGGIGSARVQFHPEMAGKKDRYVTSDTAGVGWGIAIGAQDSPLSAPDFLRFGSEADYAGGSPNAYRLTYESSRGEYQLGYFKDGSPNKLMSFTASTWNPGGYSGGGQLLFGNGFHIGQPGDAGRSIWVKMQATASSYATLAALTNFNVVRGQVIFFQSPSRGQPLAAVATASGTLGTTGVLTPFGFSYLEVSVAYTVPALAAGARTTQTINVSGVSLGDYVTDASFSLALPDGVVIVGKEVSANNFVKVTLQNVSGGASAASAAGTLSVAARRKL